MEQGTFLGRYRLGQVLGSGAMGEVYQATDPKLNGRKVAIKTILKSRMLDPKLAEEYSQRFDREAAFVSSLSHPNIVTVHDFGNEAEVAYLVMEFIDGKELKSFLDAKYVYAIDEAVAIVCQLLEALAYAHERFIFHRDIKPANIMIDARGWVKLTDFGVARQSDANGNDATMAGGTLVGTPSYMSPEQIKGVPAVAGSDLFATGVVLYQCLTLHKPFVGESSWEIWDQTVNLDPPPLSKYRDGVPPALERALLRALAKNPKDRPESARAMIDELKAAIAGESFDADATRIVGGHASASGRDDSSLPMNTRGGSLSGQTSRTGGGTGARTFGGSTGVARDTLSHQNSEIELEFWRSIKDSGDLEEFQLFIERFPAGNYSDLARRKMSKLAGSTTGFTSAGAREDTDASVAQQIAEQEEKVRLLKNDQERRIAQATRERQLQLEREEAARQEQARVAALEASKAAAEAERRAIALAEEQAQRKRDEEAARERAEAAQRQAAVLAEQARQAALDAERRAAADAATEAEAKRVRDAEQEAARIKAASAEKARAQAAEEEKARALAAAAEQARIQALEEEAARIKAAAAQAARAQAAEEAQARALAAAAEQARIQAIEQEAARIKAAEEQAAMAAAEEEARVQAEQEKARLRAEALLQAEREELELLASEQQAAEEREARRKDADERALREADEEAALQIRRKKQAEADRLVAEQHAAAALLAEQEQFESAEEGRRQDAERQAAATAAAAAAAAVAAAAELELADMTQIVPIGGYGGHSSAAVTAKAADDGSAGQPEHAAERARQDAQAQAQAQAEAQAKAQAEAQAKAQAEAQAQAQAQADAKAQAQAQAEAEAKTQAAVAAEAEAEAAAAAAKSNAQALARQAAEIAEREQRAITAELEKEVKAAGIERGLHAPAQAVPSKAPMFIGAAVTVVVLVGAGLMLTSKTKDAAPGRVHDASSPAPVETRAAPPVQASPPAQVPVPAPVPAPAPAPPPTREVPVERLPQVADKPAGPDAAALAGKAKEDAAKLKDAASLADAKAKKELAAQKAADELRLREEAKLKETAKQKTLDDAQKANAARDDAAKKAADQARIKEEAAAKAARDLAEQKSRDAAKVAKDLADQKARDDEKAKLAAPAKAKPKGDPDALFAQAQQAEQAGRAREAVDLYKQAYAAGNGRAARMLGDIYGRGSGDVGRDYGEQLQWYEKAKAAGVEVPTTGKRKY